MEPNNPNPNQNHSDNQNQNPSVDENNNDNPQEPNNESEEDENEYYDHLPAAHPHLRRFQMSLEDQMKTEEEKIRLLYKEKSEDSKKLKREREEIGITLYSLQQQFATVENAFNEKYSQCRALEEQVKQEENRLTEELKMYNHQCERTRKDGTSIT